MKATQTQLDCIEDLMWKLECEVHGADLLTRTEAKELIANMRRRWKAVAYDYTDSI